MTLLQDLGTLRHLLFTRARGASHGERLESFYRGQAHGYDDFRKRLLQGREELIARLPLEAGATWVDLGGGTGANLAMAGERLAGLKRAYVVDLCPSLAAVARTRAVEAGWGNVEVVEGDATAFRPAAGPVDVLTFSYSLTMIPDWFRAIDHALELLRPGGTLGVVDFFVSRKYPAAGRVRHSWLQRNFWPVWFGNDNVWLSADHLPYLESRTLPLECTEHCTRVPYFPGLQVPYYLYLGRRM